MNTRFVDYALFPKINGKFCPPIFVAEVAAGSPLEQGQYHKDFQKMSQTMSAILACYMGMADPKDISKLRVFGCYTANMCFQFCMAYPEEVPDGSTKRHIVFLMPREWRVDFTCNDVFPSNQTVFVQNSNGAAVSDAASGFFSKSSKMCFVGDSEMETQENDTNLASESEKELFKRLEDTMYTDDNLDDMVDGAETDALRMSDTAISTNAFYNKLRFLKAFGDSVKDYHTLVLCTLSLDMEKLPLVIPQSQVIVASRGDHNLNTSKKNAATTSLLKNADPSLLYSTPTKGHTTRNGATCYFVVKLVGSHELEMLKYLQIFKSRLVCEYRGYEPTSVNNDTMLFFEPLLDVQAIVFASYTDCLEASIRYVADGLDALQFLKEIKVFHRDMSPANIMAKRNENGKLQFKLIDFGHATFQANHSDADVYGTEGFTDPSRPFTFQSDLYSLGKSTEITMFHRMMYMDEDTDDCAFALDGYRDIVLAMRQKKDIEYLKSSLLEFEEACKNRFGYGHAG